MNATGQLKLKKDFDIDRDVAIKFLQKTMITCFPNVSYIAGCSFFDEIMKWLEAHQVIAPKDSPKTK